MKKSLIIFVALLLLVLPFASAVTEKTINIKSDPDRNFVIRIKDSTKTTILSSVYGKADSSGNAEIPFNISRNQFSFLILSVYNGEIEKTEETDVFDITENINIDLSSIIPEEPNNTIIEENTTALENPDTNLTTEAQVGSGINESKNFLAGFAISDSIKSNSKNIGYAIMAIIILLLIIFGVKRIVKRNKKADYADDEDDEKSDYFKIQKAESKIEEARKEIAELKKKEIEKEERTISREQQRLAKLRGNKKAEPKQNQDIPKKEEPKKDDSKKDGAESFY